MSPAAANTAEEKIEFTEMKPMSIQNQFATEPQDISKLSEAERQAQIAAVLLNIANIQKQIQEGEKADFAVAALPEGSASETDFAVAALPEGSASETDFAVAALPEGSVLERAFAPPVPKSERAARAPTPYSDVVDDEDLVEDVPPTPIRSVKTEPAQASQANPTDLVNNVYSGLLHIDAVFHSFADFDAAFRTWKEAGHHPMRIASSEALKDPSGRVDERFRYKNAVYHCAHYGKPRFRGNGARPNQSYLPCGCPAMFRLNFNYGEQVLRVSSMNTEHVGHPVTYEHYKAVCSNIRSARKSRTSGEAWTPISSTTASPSTPYTSTPYPVKQELFENNYQNQQSNDGAGSSTTPFNSGLRREDDEEYTPIVKRARMETQPATSNSGHQIPTPTRIENVGYQVNHEESEDNVIDVPALPGLQKVQVGAQYKNWVDFEASFENWKSVGMHPMRVASSETMKDLNGVPNLTFKYKYVVYHCAHYGTPRTRGNGMRPNQSYLPCGCGCMLRLAYNFEDQTLRVNAMVAEHRGHPRDRKSFERVMAKIRSSRGRHVNSSVTTPVSAFGGSLTQPGTPNGAPLDYAQLASMLQAQTQMTIRLLQQSQSLPNSMNLDLAAILNGMGQNIQQQPTTSQNTEDINDIGRPVAQYLEGGEIVREFNADLKDL